MGRYDSHKFPFQSQLNQWVRNRSNSVMEKMAKSIPCHVVKVEKDFLHVAFETANGIFTPPVVKIPTSMSPYGREPTQVGDKGYGVPGHYYLGGVTGDSGGNTNFYPRGNLTTLSFQHTSHTQSADRNYDQHHNTGGPEGWIARTFQPQQQDQNQNQTSQNGGGGGGAGVAGVHSAMSVASNRTRMMNIQRSIASVNGAGIRTLALNSLAAPTVAAASSGGGGSGSSSGGGSGQQDQSQTQFQFDKNDLCTIQSKDEEHNITVNQQGKKITLKIPVGEWGYAGGDGQKGKYARIMTESGPSVNFKARIS